MAQRGVPAIVLFIVALPLRYSQLPTGWAFRGQSCNNGVSRSVSTLWAHYCLRLSLWGRIGPLPCCSSGANPLNPMALLVGLFLVVFGLNFPPSLQLLADWQPIVDLFVTLLGALTYICLDGLFFLFPDGRFRSSLDVAHARCCCYPGDPIQSAS